MEGLLELLAVPLQVGDAPHAVVHCEKDVLLRCVVCQDQGGAGGGGLLRDTAHNTSMGRQPQVNAIVREV